MIRLLGLAMALMTAEPATAQFTGGTNETTTEIGNTSFEPSTDYVQNNGLAVRVMFIGRGSGDTATISVEFRNATNDSIWVALIGPTPNAVDTAGNTYAITQIAGIATCSNLANRYISDCLTRESHLPSGAFTQLSKGAASLVNLTLSGASLPETGFLSVTMTAALASGEAPSAGQERSLSTVPISLPLIALEDQ